MKKEIQICQRCVMDDSSDNTISFDKNGMCNYCTTAIERMKYLYFPNETGKQKISDMVETLRKNGAGKKYDCIMGLSGGLDSSYLAYLGYKWGLRILAVHIDDGFDTEISVNNLNKLSKACKLDLKIEKPDAKQFQSLTKAYMKAGVPNVAIPQDNLIFACMYKYARKYKIRYFLSGTNYALESITQKGNSHNPFDIINIKDIHRAYGEEPIDKLSFLSDYKRFFDKKLLGIKTVRPLNFVDYNRENALKELAEFCDFKYYGSKHLENKLTKFIQLYWVFNKFNVDKRKSHLSSMIVSGQMTRDKALVELKKPLYDEEQMQIEIREICQSLNITQNEFDNIMKEKTRQHTDFRIDRFNILYNRLFNK
jgi:N-acetyl sugar amidotransferase